MDETQGHYIHFFYRNSFWIVTAIQSPVCLCFCISPAYRCLPQPPEKNVLRFGVYGAYRGCTEFFLVDYCYPEPWNTGVIKRVYGTTTRCGIRRFYQYLSQ
jgi:hypothetical protein